ncbi:unnamed protein product [Musa hybrid cultivar]
MGLGLEPRSSRRGRLFAATWVDVAGERRPSPPATPTDKRTLPTVRSGRAGGGDRMGCEDRRFTHPVAAVSVARHVPSCRLEDCRVR